MSVSLSHSSQRHFNQCRNLQVHTGFTKALPTFTLAFIHATYNTPQSIRSKSEIKRSAGDRHYQYTMTHPQYKTSSTHKTTTRPRGFMTVASPLPLLLKITITSSQTIKICKVFILAPIAEKQRVMHLGEARVCQGLLLAQFLCSGVHLLSR